MGEIASGDTFADAFGLADPWMLAILVAALAGVFVLGSRMERDRRGPVSAEQAVAGADEALTR